MQVGHKCPLDGTNRTFDYCIKECGAKCYRDNLPLLLALIPEQRPVVSDLWSVTQITKPPQITLLDQKHDYYVLPRHTTFMQWGTAWHNMIESQRGKLEELGVADKYIMEQRFNVKIPTSLGEIGLRGTPDLYIPHTKTLWDYKTTKAYSIGKAFKSNEEWLWQLNIYRHYGFPEAEKMVVCGIVRDHSWRVEEKEGIEEITIRDVEKYLDKDVEDYVTEKLVYLKTCQDNNLYPRPCTDEERWLNYKGEYMRCERYCPVKDFCNQYQDEQRD